MLFINCKLKSTFTVVTLKINFLSTIETTNTQRKRIGGDEFGYRKPHERTAYTVWAYPTGVGRPFRTDQRLYFTAGA